MATWGRWLPYGSWTSLGEGGPPARCRWRAGHAGHGPAAQQAAASPSTAAFLALGHRLPTNDTLPITTVTQGLPHGMAQRARRRPRGHEGHDHGAMVADFERRFWICLPGPGNAVGGPADAGPAQLERRAALLRAQLDADRPARDWRQRTRR